mgnify:CR=1 FL=1
MTGHGVTDRAGTGHGVTAPAVPTLVRLALPAGDADRRRWWLVAAASAAFRRASIAPLNAPSRAAYSAALALSRTCRSCTGLNSIGGGVKT